MPQHPSAIFHTERSAQPNKLNLTERPCAFSCTLRLLLPGNACMRKSMYSSGEGSKCSNWRSFQIRQAKGSGRQSRHNLKLKPLAETCIPACIIYDQNRPNPHATGNTLGQPSPCVHPRESCAIRYTPPVGRQPAERPLPKLGVGVPGCPRHRILMLCHPNTLCLRCKSHKYPWARGSTAARLAEVVEDVALWTRGAPPRAIPCLLRRQGEGNGATGRECAHASNALTDGRAARLSGLWVCLLPRAEQR